MDPVAGTRKPALKAPGMSRDRSRPPTVPGDIRAGLLEIYRHISPSRRRKLYRFLALMVAGAIAELATIGAVLPFVSTFVGGGGISRLPGAERVLRSLHLESSHDQLIAATLSFGAVVVAAGLIRLWLAFETQEFSFGLGHEVLVEIQRRLLLQPYEFYAQRNTSTLLSVLEKSESLIFDVLLQLMQSGIAAFLSICIIAALIYIAPTVSLLAAGAFVAAYLAVSAAVRPQLLKNSSLWARALDDRLRVAQESFGGIRDIVIDDSHDLHLRLFERANFRLNRARANTAFIATAPRYVIEMVAVAAMAGIAVYASQKAGGYVAALPTLGAVALGAQRLVPLLQQIYSGWSNASGSSAALGDISDLLRLPLPGREVDPPKPMPFRRNIEFRDVGFHYPGVRGRVLSKISLEIDHGSMIAVAGPSGSGKSTFADLLTGLLTPTEGQISIDGKLLSPANARSWQRNIAHVPQTIFLPDTTIAENIALGRAGEELDKDRLSVAAKAAQLDEFIASLPESYETIVGEDGVRLSGGQRQRIGIARAIYKGSPVVILDEATSALDEDTEAALFRSLKAWGSQGRTILIIAHRKSTLDQCDRIIRFRNGRTVESDKSKRRQASSSA